MSDASFEQELAKVRDTLPRLWWSLYTGALEAGFTEQQAMDLLKAYVFAQAGTLNKGN